MYQRNDEIRRSSRHFRAKCVIQCLKTRFEVKVLELSAGQWPKHTIQKYNRILEKGNNGLLYTSQQWKPLERAEICHCKKDSCKLKNLNASQWKSSRWWQEANRCYKKRLEADTVAKCSAIKYYWRVPKIVFSIHFMAVLIILLYGIFFCCRSITLDIFWNILITQKLAHLINFWRYSTFCTCNWGVPIILTRTKYSVICQTYPKV